MSLHPMWTMSAQEYAARLETGQFARLEINEEERLLNRLNRRMASRTSANVKAHLTRRIQNCEARIAALKLAYA